MKTAENWKQEGIGFTNEGQYEKAIRCFDKCIELDPNDTEALNFKALIFIEQDMYEDAVNCCDQAIKINPNEAETWYGKGRTLGKMHNFEEAFDCLNKAVELDPEKPEYQEFKKKASEKLKKIIIPEDLESSLEDEDECMKQGNVYLAEELYKNAHLCFAKAVKFNPENDKAWGCKGITLIFLDRFDEAVDAFDKAISINEEAYYWSYKGLALEKLEKKDEAITCMSKSVEIDPKDEENWLRYGKILDERDKYRGAIHCYKEVIKLNPRNVKAWSYMGDLLLHGLGLDKESVYYYDKATELSPDDDDALLMKGNALSYVGQQEEAIKCYDKALEINPDNKYAMENKGSSYIKLGKRKEAMACYKEAAKNNTLKGGLFFQGAESFLESEYEEALEYFDEELKKNPSEDTLLSMKALTLVKLAKYEEAMQCYLRCKYNVLNIFVSVVSESDIQKSIEERRQLLPYIDGVLKNDDFFMSMAGQITENYELYKDIYIRAMEIISLLYVDSNFEELISTYTSDCVVKNLLIEKSPLWLSLVTKSNDPDEGQTLLDYLYKGKALKEEEQFGVFSASFTFNHDHLNHFRLYGKSGGVETSGASIIVNKHLFSENDIQYTVSSIVKKNRPEGKPTVNNLNKYIDNKKPKLPLFRCIYIDPETGFVASLGQREEYTFYRLKKDTQALSSYQNVIENILDEVRQQLKELKTKTKKLKPEIVSQLLLPLRYLVKNVSFKEEQECRVFIVKSLDDKNIKVCGTIKYFDYLEINEHVSKLILGTNCRLKSDSEFLENCKSNGIMNIESSRWQFNIDKHNLKV